MTAVQNIPPMKRLNWMYFYNLLFTRMNLKLVQIVCHNKKEHSNAKCDPLLYYHWQCPLDFLFVSPNSFHGAFNVMDAVWRTYRCIKAMNITVFALTIGELVNHLASFWLWGKNQYERPIESTPYCKLTFSKWLPSHVLSSSAF